MKRTGNSILLVLIFWEPRAFVSGAKGEIRISAPEGELRKIENELSLLDLEVDAVIRIQKNPSLYVNRLGAAKTLEQARKLLNTGQFRAAESFYNKFLKDVQSPDKNDLKACSLGLFKIYLNLGDFSKASEEVSRYVTVFLSSTGRDYDEFTGVLKTIVGGFPVNRQNRTGLRKFLTALETIQYPPEYRYEILYLLAYLAKREGLSRLASQWLANASMFSDSGELKSKTLFYQGIIALRMGKLSQAEKLFQTTLLRGSKDEQAVHNYAQLALARIYFYQGHGEKARDHYHLVPDNSPLYQAALLELSLLSAGLGLWKEAHTYAVSYLADTGADPQTAAEFAPFVPFFELQAGRLNEAGASLRQSIENLSRLKASLRHFMPEPGESQQDTLLRLQNLTRGLISTPPLLSQMLRGARQIQHLDQRLESLQGFIHNFIIALGRARIEDINSQDHNRYLQLMRISHDLLFLAERLSVSEAMIFRDIMAKKDLTALKLLALRRKKLLEAKMDYYRNHPYFSTEQDLWKSTGQLSRVWNKLYRSEATLASARYLHGKFAKKSSHARQLENMRRQSGDLNLKLRQILEQIRMVRVQGQIASYQDNPEKKLVAQYAGILTEEAKILEKTRNQSTRLSLKQSADEIQAAWKHWHLLMDQVHSQAQTIEETVTQNTRTVLEDLRLYRHESAKILAILSSGKQAFREIFPVGMDFVKSHLAHAISDQASRYHKWEADASWEQYAQTNKKHVDDQSSFQAEKVSLDMYIEQIKQGVLESWSNPLP